MADDTAGRLAAALRRPEEADSAGRLIFLVLLWVSALVGLIAQVTDGASGTLVSVATAVLVALAIWVHIVHRLHTWRSESPARIAIMLVGVYTALVGLLLIDPAYLILLFGVYSLTFGFVTSVRPAAGLSFVVTMIWIGAWLYHDLPTGAIVTPVLVWATLVAITMMISRVEAQSRERRDLLVEIHETRSQLAEAERQRGVLEERQRVAAEIHDTLAQGFTSIVLLSQAMRTQAAKLSAPQLADKLGLVEQTARDNLTATRRLVQDLHPIELERATFVDAIRNVAQKHQAATGVDVQVRVVGDVVPLGGTADVAMLRSVQEALANAAKHADADHMSIVLTYHDAGFQAAVTDDGVGFDLASPAAEVAGVRGGRGLGLMGDRLAALGGTSSIASAAGKGTTVELSLPKTSRHGIEET